MRAKLKNFRVNNGLTQEKIAAKIGVCRSLYGHVETGARDGTKAFWDKLKNAFGLTFSDIAELMKIDSEKRD